MVGVIGIARDVTGELKLTANLEADRARLVAAQEVAKIGSWSFDVASQTFGWTKQTDLVCGTDAERFAPTVQSLRALIHPDDLPAVLAVSACSVERPAPTHRVEHIDNGIGMNEATLSFLFTCGLTDVERACDRNGSLMPCCPISGASELLSVAKA